MSDLVYWIWFASRRGLRSTVRRKLLESIGSPKEIFAADEKTLLGCGAGDDELAALAEHDISEAERILFRCEEENVRILTMQDAEFPERLRNIPDPPYVLYIKGRLPAVDSEAVITIVGTRSSTPYGEKMARDIAYGIAKGGGIVVTGLAKGIDTRAAQGALLAGGRVIGVLGTGIDEVYPPFNGDLFADVAATGALVSEYPPKTPANKINFPARNRIMAGLALGTVVVEAPLRSGALITAHRAADYGRDVFAVPGNADSANSRGCNGLIREGASLAENAWDILGCYEELMPDRIDRTGRLKVPEEMALPEDKEQSAGNKPEQKENTSGEGFFKLRVPVRKKKTEAEKEPLPGGELAKQLSALNENQLKIVGVMTKPSMHIDYIIDLSHLSAATVLAEMTMLQIKGFVAQESGKCFTLKIAKRGT